VENFKAVWAELDETGDGWLPIHQLRQLIQLLPPPLGYSVTRDKMAFRLMHRALLEADKELVVLIRAQGGTAGRKRIGTTLSSQLSYVASGGLNRDGFHKLLHSRPQTEQPQMVFHRVLEVLAEGFLSIDGGSMLTIHSYSETQSKETFKQRMIEDEAVSRISAAYRGKASRKRQDLHHPELRGRRVRLARLQDDAEHAAAQEEKHASLGGGAEISKPSSWLRRATSTGSWMTKAAKQASDHAQYSAVLTQDEDLHQSGSLEQRVESVRMRSARRDSFDDGDGAEDGASLPELPPRKGSDAPAGNPTMVEMALRQREREASDAAGGFVSPRSGRGRGVTDESKRLTEEFDELEQPQAGDVVVDAAKEAEEERQWQRIMAAKGTGLTPSEHSFISK